MYGILFPMAFFVERPGPGERAQQMPESISLTEALWILILNWMAVTSSLLPEPYPLPGSGVSSPTPFPEGPRLEGPVLSSGKRELAFWVQSGMGA